MIVPRPTAEVRLARAALAALLLAFASFTALSAYTERSAHANGRFPRAQTILTSGDRVVLRATFGLMISEDHGKTFDWVCEQAIGFSGPWDPPLAVRGRTIYLGLADGLRTTEGGCAFTRVAELEGQLVSDLSEERGTVWLATSTPKDPAFVWRSRDGGRFERLGKGIPGIYVDTLDVDRGTLGRPARVYATGVEVGKNVAPHLFRSDDGGVSFRELHPAWPSEGRLYLASVDRTNADRLLIRTLGVKGSDLLLSEDGGATVRVVFHFDGAMFGFARDGDDVWVGSGTPSEGLHRSTDGGKTFTKVRDQLVYCLHADGSRLYGCSEPYAPSGYAIALSEDRGATWRSLATFSDVRGPLACDAGDGAKCVDAWPPVKLMLGTQVSTTLPVDASVEGGADASVGPLAPAKDRSRCGCDTVGAPSGNLGLAGLLLGLSLIVLHRRGSS